MTSEREVSDLFVHGRLQTIPRRVARRQQLLQYLAHTLFDPDIAYTEREVNEALSRVHDDFAALRRYLVEAGLLVRTRDGDIYYRP